MGQWQSLGGLFVSPPDIVAWGPEQEFLFAFAIGTDQALWYAPFNGSSWGAWQSLGGTVMSTPHAIQSAESSVDVFAVGAHSDLLHWEFRKGAWRTWPLAVVIGGVLAPAPPGVVGVPYRNWESLGGILISPPHPAMFGASPVTELLVFGVGTDHALWARNKQMASWGPWTSLGHTLSSASSPVQFDGDFLMFALGTDSAIWYTNGGTWQSLGGAFASPPYAVATGSALHVFAADQHSTLRHNRWDGNSWSGWESRGGTLMSQPTAAGYQTEDSFDVFVLGTDSAIWHRLMDHSGWGDWQSLGGTFLAPPASVGRGIVEFRRDLVALGTDHMVWYLGYPAD